jgi:phosphoenolpyruvate carboxylase
MEFGTWKGGDRDGNPFVVASFTNQTFIEQKEFVLEQYVDMAKKLVDKLTPSTNHIVISEDLKFSLQKDNKKFPYIRDIKPQEPYRAKMRYILEKLENTLARVKEVKKQAGETTKPLLGLTLPGPTGNCFLLCYFIFTTRYYWRFCRHCRIDDRRFYNGDRISNSISW